jgi:hypothetical protein
MNITIFPTGTGDAGSAVRYLLSDVDHEKKKRSVQPEILFGDPDTFEAIANATKRKHKYTSGVIAFRDNEHPSPEQVTAVIEAFRSTFLPGLKVDENFADFWVMHREKGNVELHFLVANTELVSTTRLNIHPPGEKNLQFFNTFVAVMNDAFGFPQVVADPLKISLKPFEAKSPNGKKDKKAKTDLATTLHSEITGGFIADRNQLIGYLKKHGIEVPKIGSDFITVRMHGAGKNIRLRGPLFTKGADYKALVAQHHESKTPKFLTPAQARHQQTKLVAGIRARSDFNRRLYLTPKPGAKRSRAQNLGTPSPEQALGSGHVPGLNLGSLSPEGKPSADARMALQKHLEELKEHQPAHRPQLCQNIGSLPPEVKPKQEQADLPSSLLAAPALGSLEAQIGSLSMQYHSLLLALAGARGARAQTLKSQIMALEQRLVALNLELEKKKAQQAHDQSLKI